MNTKENIELNELSNKSNAKSVRKTIEYVLNPGSELEFTYTKKEYRIKCYADYKGDKSYAVYKNEIFGSGMNVVKISCTGECQLNQPNQMMLILIEAIRLLPSNQKLTFQ